MGTVLMAGATLHVQRGAVHVYRTEDAGELWCFHCRKRLPHTAELRGDPPEIESYYEPLWSRTCSGCGEDHTTFPGMDPWGGEA